MEDAQTQLTSVQKASVLWFKQHSCNEYQLQNLNCQHFKIQDQQTVMYWSEIIKTRVSLSNKLVHKYLTRDLDYVQGKLNGRNSCQHMNGNVKMKQQKIYNINEGDLLKAGSRQSLCCGYTVFKETNLKHGKK